MKCEVCGYRSSICVRHHIQSKSCGGTNEKHNLAVLCPNCHADVHQGNVVLEGKFMTTAGLQLIWRHSGDTTVTGQQPEVYIQNGKSYKQKTD